MITRRKTVFVYSLLFKGVLEDLKEKSGAKNQRDAIRAAVSHYLKCDRIDE